MEVHNTMEEIIFPTLWIIITLCACEQRFKGIPEENISYTEYMINFFIYGIIVILILILISAIYNTLTVM